MKDVSVAGKEDRVREGKSRSGHDESLGSHSCSLGEMLWVGIKAVGWQRREEALSGVECWGRQKRSS